jgi:hypothetical protein
LTDFDQAQALSYLKTGDRLAVMPSTEDNSPSAILECLEDSIPFLASSGSGGEELLDEESRYHNLFEPSVDALCDKLLDMIAAGGGRTARPSFSPNEIQRAFGEWMENALASAARPMRANSKATLIRKPMLMVIVPPETPINQAVADLKRADAFHGRIHIEVLTSQPKVFEKSLAALGKTSPINVSDLRDFSKIAQSLSAQDPAVLGICHLSQILTPEWFERARQCFENTEHICALTGMAGETTENNEQDGRRFVSRLNKRHAVRRYLVGNASPLFALMQSTNSGFLLMRSELAGQLGVAHAIMDEQYERLIPMEELIHAMLISLHQSGHSFELVPDLLHAPVRELPVEGLQSGNFTRALATSLYGHARGTDQWLISRLAIDSGLKRKRLLESDDYRTYLAAKTGITIAPVNSETTWDQQSYETWQ